MPAYAATLAIKIVSDAQGAVAGMDQASGRLGKFQSGLKKAAIPAAIAGAAILKFGSDAIDSASRTQQAMGAIESVFGKNAGTVEKWASGAAENLGLAKSEYGELASTIGASLKNTGMPMQDVTKNTGDMIKMGADLAATYGGTTKDAVEALGAALRGEADPAERYGLALNQTRVQAELAAKGQDKLTGNALATAKAQTILEMATKQAGGAVGQFARESDSASGSAQIAAAQWENAKSALGESLLPAVSAVTAKLGTLAKWMGEHTTLAKVLAGLILGLSAAVFVLIAALKVYEITLRIVKAVQEATWLASLGPIALIIAAVLAVVAIFVVLYKKVGWFRDFVDATWAAIKSATLAVASAVRKAFIAAFNALKPVFSVVARIFKSVWQAAFTVVKTYVQVWWAAFKLAFNVIKGIIKVVVAIFKGDWRGALDAVRGIISAFGSFFRSLWSALGSPVRALAGLIRSAMTGAINAVRGFIGRAAQAARDTASRIVSAVAGFVGNMYDAGVDLIMGLINGVRDKAGDLAGAAMDAVKGAVDGVRGFLHIGSPSKLMQSIGRDTMAGFIKGITGSESAAARAFDSLANIIKRNLEGKAERAETAYLNRAKRRWDGWLRARESIANKVAAADARVRDRIAEMASYAGDVAQGARDFASGLTTELAEGEVPTANAFIANMAARLDALKTFTANIKTLAARGLNQSTLRELVDAGVEGGATMAQAMVTGGASAIKSVNALQGQIGSTAKNLGDYAGDKFYGAGVKSAKAIAKGLHSQQAELVKQMRGIARNMADALVDEINRALKQANANGSGGSSRAARSAPSVAPAPQVRALGATTASTGGGGGTVVINVHGALDPEAVARQIRRILDGHDRRVGLSVA